MKIFTTKLRITNMMTFNHKNTCKNLPEQNVIMKVEEITNVAETSKSWILNTKANLLL